MKELASYQALAESFNIRRFGFEFFQNFFEGVLRVTAVKVLDDDIWAC